ASAAVALAIGVSVASSPLLLLALLLIYALTVPADSGALTSGMAMSASPSHKGATLAMHSTVGFGVSALGAWGAGLMLDLAGGPHHASAWSAMFALLAGSILLGPLALWWARRGRPGAGEQQVQAKTLVGRTAGPYKCGDTKPLPHFVVTPRVEPDSA